MREYIVRVDNNKFTIEGEIVRCKECRNRYTQQRCAGKHPNWFCAAGVKQVTGKLESAENATSEGDGSTMGQPKSKLYIPLNQHTVERINRLHKNDCGDYFDEEWLYNELEQIAEILQPPVTPTERTGEWIKSYLTESCGTNENHDLVYRKIPCVKCDQCGEKRRHEEKFCPNCGAKMKGGTENE